MADPTESNVDTADGPGITWTSLEEAHNAFIATGTMCLRMRLAMSRATFDSFGPPATSRGGLDALAGFPVRIDDSLPLGVWRPEIDQGGIPTHLATRIVCSRCGCAWESPAHKPTLDCRCVEEPKEIDDGR